MDKIKQLLLKATEEESTRRQHGAVLHTVFTEETLKLK